MAHKGKQETVFISINMVDGTVAIMQFVTLIKRNKEDPGFVREATPENIEAEIIKSRLDFVSWRIIDPKDLPQDRSNRNDWKDDGVKIRPKELK